MAQTTPGITTTYEPPTAFWLTVIAAAVSWALTVAGAIAEITDDFPLGLVGLAAVLAGSITVGAMHQRAEHASQRRHAEVVEVAGALTAQVEQVSAKVGTYWEGYTAGVHDVNGVKTLNATRGEGRQSPN